MGPFFDWACELHSNIQEDTIHYGVLAAVAAVLKHGKRDDLLPYAPKLLDWVTTQKYKHHNAMLVRKYGVKIVQRIGKYKLHDSLKIIIPTAVQTIKSHLRQYNCQD